MKIIAYIDVPSLKTLAEGQQFAAKLAEDICNGTANEDCIIQTIHSQVLIQRKES